MRPEKGHVTRLLRAVHQGDRRASEQLLPAVYDELRKLARARMAHVPPGNTLQPTALVHEAYIRLVGKEDPGWDGRGHFFAAASQAMRQILVDQARRKSARRHGGDQQHVDIDNIDVAMAPPCDDILALDRALERLEAEEPRKAQLVLLRYFAGLNRDETAAAMGVSARTVDREWRYVVARLHQELSDSPPKKR